MHVPRFRSWALIVFAPQDCVSHPPTHGHDPRIRTMADAELDKRFKLITTGSFAVVGLQSEKAPKYDTPAPKSKKAAPKKAADDDDDDMDLFDDDEEEDAAPSSRAEQAKALKAKKEKEMAEKKQAALDRLAKKEAKQRSLCNLEIKPWEAEQDLNDLFKRIKEKVQPEGLKWSENCKLVEVAFGVKKMLLTAVLPMNLSMDAIIEDMTEDIFPDEIQSMNMTSMSLL